MKKGEIGRANPQER
jgi:hypothetical protein